METEGLKPMVLPDGKSELYTCDCCDLMRRMISDGVKVDLTVTSPPYDSIRSYDGAGDAWCFDKFKEAASLLYGITADGGVVVWVVGDQTVGGSESLTSFRQAIHFKEVGFDMWDTMIYEKNSSSFPARRDSKRYTQIFEYMFVLSKGTPSHATLICDKPNKWAGHTNWGNRTYYDKEGNLVGTGRIKPVPEFSPRNNIWRYTTSFNINRHRHPAVFPFLLARDSILSWSREGDTVFDPFSGSGTTASAAITSGRRFVGCEIVDRFATESMDNISEYWGRHMKGTLLKN